VGPVSSVEMLLDDNKGNQIIPHTTWETFIARRTDIEQLLQSPTPSSLVIQDLIIDFVKLRNADCKIEITRSVCM